MKKRAWKEYALWIGLTEVLGAAAGLLTRSGMKQYEALAEKPALTPPGIVFPIAWTALYALMGVGLARARLRGTREQRRDAVLSWAVQLFFNLGWTGIFFGFHAYGAAFLWLAVLFVLAFRMALSFSEADRTAAWLQLPYLLWLLFAGWLNYGVWLLNR